MVVYIVIYNIMQFKKLQYPLFLENILAPKLIGDLASFYGIKLFI